MDFDAMKQAIINAQEYEIEKWRSLAIRLANQLSLTSDLNSSELLKEFEESFYETTPVS